MITIAVTNDMGHLSWNCSDGSIVPRSIMSVICNDTDSALKQMGSHNIVSIFRKPGVPKRRVFGNYIIDYHLHSQEEEQQPQQQQPQQQPQLQQGLQIPGEHYLCQIDNIFTSEQCRRIIHRANTIQTDDKGNRSWHRPGTGGKYMRAIIRDEHLAKDLYSRLNQFIPSHGPGPWNSVYINPVFRISRYSEGGHFPIHVDGQNYDNSRPDITGLNSAISQYTLNIFINDDFQGGETDFFHSPNKDDLRHSVKPKPGRGALFYHGQYHCGNPVHGGYKYLIRTDVMAIMS